MINFVFKLNKSYIQIMIVKNLNLIFFSFKIYGVFKQFIKHKIN